MVKSWICYAGLLGAFLYLQYYYNDPFSLMLAFGLALLLPLSLLYALLGYWLLRCGVTASHTAVEKGENVAVCFRFENRGLLFYPRVWAVCQVMGQPKKQARRVRLSLAGRESRWVEYNAPCAFCGVFENAVLKLRFCDPLGLFRFSHKVRRPLSVLVLPRLIPLPPSSSLRQEEEALPNAPESNERGVSSVAGVRDYVPGDPLRSIHWKLTAKWNHLMVKEFDFLKQDRERVFIDRYSPKPDLARTDCLIETAAALALRFVTENRPADFCWYKEGGTLVDSPLATREDFERFLPLLTASKELFAPQCKPEELLKLLGNPAFFSGAPVTVITPSQEAEFYQALLNVADLRQFPVWLIFVGKANPPLTALFQQLQSAGAAVSEITGGEIAAAIANVSSQ